MWIATKNARVTRVLFALLVVALCASLAACGSSTDSSSQGSASASKNPRGTGGPAGGPVTAADIKTAQDFVGGKSGKATGTPIKVGWIQQLSGPFPPQDGNKVPDAARKFINDKLGGVDGHPIEFVTCDIGATDEKAQACGQQLHNDPSIKAVFNPAQPTGGLATQAAINGQPMMFCAYPTTAEAIGKNVLCPPAGVNSANNAITYFKDVLKIKNVALILPDGELFRQVAVLLKSQFAPAGVKQTTAQVPAGSPDVTAALVGAKVKDAGGIYLTLSSSAQCAAVAKGLKSLGVSDSTPVVALTTCNTPAVAKALGGDLPHWTFIEEADSSQLPKPTPQTQTYLDAIKTYGNNQGGPNGEAFFGTMLWMTQVMNKVGADKLTTKNLMAEGSKFTGPGFLFDSKQKFGTSPWRNTGSLRARFFSYQGDGKWTDATNGKWLDAPVAN